MKQCIKCKKILSLVNFYKDKQKKDGLRPRCKKCEKDYIDKERRRKYEKEYWGKRKERRQEILRKARKKHYPKGHKKRQERYGTLAFKLAQKGYIERRKKRTYPVLFTKEELRNLITSNKKCYYCGKSLDGNYEIDHKTPLSRGGKSVINNLAMSCRSCNRKKGTLTEEEYRRCQNQVDPALF